METFLFSLCIHIYKPFVIEFCVDIKFSRLCFSGSHMISQSIQHYLLEKNLLFQLHSSGTLPSIKWIFTCNLYFIICSSLYWYHSILISLFYGVLRIYQYKYLIFSFLVLLWLFMPFEFIINFNIYLSILIYIHTNQTLSKKENLEFTLALYQDYSWILVALTSV